MPGLELFPVALKVHLSHPASLPAPLTAAQLTRFFSAVARELSSEPEFARATKRLGRVPVGLGVRFCDDAEMRSLQRRFRRLDRTTDILSFPALEMLEGVPSGRAAREVAKSWGDVVLSLPAVLRGARRGRRTVADELAEVLIHGFLHLLGLDHVRPRVSVRGRARMLRLQRATFRSLRGQMPAVNLAVSAFESD